MKRVKVGVIIVLAAVAGYCIVSYGIFFVNKASLDKQLLYEKDEVVIQKQSSLYDENTDQFVKHDLEYHKNLKPNFEDVGEDKPVQLVIVPDEKQADVENFVLPESKEQVEPEMYSFVSMPIDLFQQNQNHSISAQGFFALDVDAQESFDILIGNDFNSFINLVLQSNNDIVSQQACRSCELYALFKKVKNHKDLTENEIRTLQHIIDNLCRFMDRMKQLSKSLMMSPEQYTALQDLNRPQTLKQAMRLQARKAATSAALRKLQSIKYNN